jgi:Tol biopolymer transport system component/DNA-binding winged helix-turn-helix (wHTH) protein
VEQSIQTGYGFGEFCLDIGERRLLRSGVEVPLPPKVFDTLVLLVENAGHLIEKDEFVKRLWPDTFVGDDALARNISTLRKGLGESGDSQALVETVPTRGYRFVAAVRQIQLPERLAAQVEFAATLQVPREVAPPDKERLRRAAFVLVAVAIGSLAGLVTFWLFSPVPAPRVVRTTQITHSGRVDSGLPIVSDGSRIYFLERYGDHWNLMQTSVSGGEPQAVAAPFRNTLVLDVSPDRTNLLIGSFSRRFEHMPLWIWPVQGGAPKRVGEITAYYAIWCPDGRRIVYNEDDGIYQVDADGTKAHKFVATDGTPGDLHWSPDGRRLRFPLSPHQVEAAAMWEINADGTNLHRLLPGWDKPPGWWDGAWTADGRYFVFDSTHSGTQDIWAIREGSGLFRRHAAQPVRLTAGPITFGEVLPGKDGHTVFVTGADWKNELVRYDLQSRQFHPFFPDLHAIYISYSQDGAWLAYVHAENSVLARMKADGTQPLDLTPPGLRTWDPRWSRDGRQILFTGLTEKGQHKLFLVSAEGGTARELFTDDGNQDEASWSPDGKSISFVNSVGPSASAQSPAVIQVLNLATNQLTVLPGSRDMGAPTWSPDGHLLTTVTDDGHKLMLLDLRTQKWTKLAEGGLFYGGQFRWSPDSKYVYCQDILAPNEPVYRIRLSDRKQELVTSFESFLRGGVQKAAVVSMAPDGSPIIALDRNQADIYALDLDLP